MQRPTYQNTKPRNIGERGCNSNSWKRELVKMANHYQWHHLQKILQHTCNHHWSCYSTHLLQLFPHFHPSPLSCRTFFHHCTLLSFLYDQFLLFYITHFQVLYIITFSSICRSYPSLALPLPLSSFVSSQLNTTLRYLFQSPTQLYLNK